MYNSESNPNSASNVDVLGTVSNDNVNNIEAAVDAITGATGNPASTPSDGSGRDDDDV